MEVYHSALVTTVYISLITAKGCNATDSQFSNNGGVSRQRLRRQLVVAVRAIEEGLSALAMTRQVRM